MCPRGKAYLSNLRTARSKVADLVMLVESWPYAKLFQLLEPFHHLIQGRRHAISRREMQSQKRLPYRQELSPCFLCRIDRSGKNFELSTLDIHLHDVPELMSVLCHDTLHTQHRQRRLLIRRP